MPITDEQQINSYVDFTAKETYYVATGHRYQMANNARSPLGHHYWSS